MRNIKLHLLTITAVLSYQAANADADWVMRQSTDAMSDVHYRSASVKGIYVEGRNWSNAPVLQVRCSSTQELAIFLVLDFQTPTLQSTYIRFDSDNAEPVEAYSGPEWNILGLGDDINAIYTAPTNRRRGTLSIIDRLQADQSVRIQIKKTGSVPHVAQFNLSGSRQAINWACDNQDWSILTMMRIERDKKMALESQKLALEHEEQLKKVRLFEDRQAACKQTVVDKGIDIESIDKVQEGTDFDFLLIAGRDTAGKSYRAICSFENRSALVLGTAASLAPE